MKLRNILVTVLTIVTVGFALAQSKDDRIKVAGRVMDEDGAPLAKVAIKYTGKEKISRSAITDSTGRFAIEDLPKKGTTLEFYKTDYVMSTQKMASSSSDVYVTLRYDDESIDSKRSAGYTTTDRRSGTSAISGTSGDDIRKAGATSSDVVKNMEGRIAGLINGMSIRGGGEPLLVVDGQINSGGMNELRRMNAEDIDRIDVLKDAAATAVYGSRGGNGVIVITTKSKARQQKK